jgi:hypothetical protein
VTLPAKGLEECEKKIRPLERRVEAPAKEIAD